MESNNYSYSLLAPKPVERICDLRLRLGWQNLRSSHAVPRNLIPLGRVDPLLEADLARSREVVLPIKVKLDHHEVDVTPILLIHHLLT